MSSKSFKEVWERFDNIQFNEKFDLIVAIASGGMIPAAILYKRLGIEVQLLKINFRDTNQKPKYESPKLIAPVDFEFKDKTILLVDDRVKTGSTLNYAKSLLEREAKTVKTFAVNGNADYFLYNEDCFKFPWVM